jgi:hypothetical protein
MPQAIGLVAGLAGSALFSIGAPLAIVNLTTLFVVPAVLTIGIGAGLPAGRRAFAVRREQ